MTKFVGYDSRSDWPSLDLALLISLLPRGRAMDIGCGHGTEALTLATHGWRVMGLNPPKDGDGDAPADYPLAAARARALKLPKRSRDRATFIPGAVGSFKLHVRDTATFDLVLDRFVYNTFLDREAGPASERRATRLALLMLAADALRDDGLFVIRFRESEPGLFGIPGDAQPFPANDRRALNPYFIVGRTVSALGVATDARDIDDLLVAKPLPTSLVVLRRRKRKTPP